MKWLWIVFLPVLVLGQEFQFNLETDSITLHAGNYQIPVPWVGGYSYTVPAFCDIDADNAPDIFVGNSSGHLTYFQNCGDSYTPDFKLITPEFQNIQGYAHSVPYFADIDADADYDLFCDFGNSPMRFYRNIGTTTTPQLILEEDSLRDTAGNLIDGSGFALCDINGNGTLDLFVQQWYSGNIYYYENVGIPNQFSFSLISTNFANVNTGYWSHPNFCDIDHDGDYDLFIGDRYGHLWFYINDGTPQQYNFTLVSNNWLGIDVGDYASPAFCDIDGDEDYDLFIGKDNYNSSTPPGAIHYWKNVGTPQYPAFVEITQQYLTFDAGSNCEPDLCDIDNDGDLDLFFLNNASLGWMENVGTTQQPSFILRSYNLLGIPPGSCDLADLNGDSLKDLVSVDGWGGTIKLWINIGGPSNPVFQWYSTISTGYLLMEVTLGDLDGDGDQDLVVGATISGWSHLLYYQNQGAPQHPVFVEVAQSLPGVTFNNVLQSCLTDMELDGDLDILVHSNWSTHTSYYENIGTPQQMNFQLVTENLVGDSLLLAVVDATDIDNDGDIDLFYGQYYGGMRFFRNITGESPVHPDPKHPAPTHPVITLLPNPGNSTIAASYELRAASKVSLKVFDITGRLTGTLFYGFQLPGTYSYTWDAREKASGVYLLRLETSDQKATQKITILK